MKKLLLILTFLLVPAFAEKKTNIILIMADDLGYECLGANGSEYKTPNLDKLAAEGARFTNCFANPLCTPSRVKIMTGIYNVRNYIKFGVLPRKEITFAHQLKKAGYATCIAGKWQLGKETDAPQHFGFDQACLWQHTRPRMNKEKLDTRFSNPQLEINGKEVNYTKGEFGPDVCTDFICDFMEKNKEKPFLVYYPMILTHCPFVPTPDSKEWNPKDFGSPTYKGDAKFFGDMTTYMDKVIGRIDKKLADLGIRDNTLLIFTGDNGTDKPVVTKMGDKTIKAGKGTMTENGTRVPMVISWPAKLKGGLVSEDLVDFADIMPTLCEVAGAPLPEVTENRAVQTDGVSLVPALLGQTREKPWIYIWYTGKVMARNKTHGIVLTKDKQMFKYSGHYEKEEVKTPQSEYDQTAFKKLQAVIDKYAATRAVKSEPKKKKKTKK